MTSTNCSITPVDRSNILASLHVIRLKVILNKHVIRSIFLREITARRFFTNVNVCYMQRKMAALGDLKTVLITDKIDPICKKVLEENGLEVALKPGMIKEDLLKEIKVCFSFALVLMCTFRHLRLARPFLKSKPLRHLT